MDCKLEISRLFYSVFFLQVHPRQLERVNGFIYLLFHEKTLPLICVESFFMYVLKVTFTSPHM